MEKLQIADQKYNINLKLYFFLKNCIKIQLTDKQRLNLLEVIFLNKKNGLDQFKDAISLFSKSTLKEGSDKSSKLLYASEEIQNETDIELFEFSLKLLTIKDILLVQAKLKSLVDSNALSQLGPLTLEYDKITTYSPYSTRVNGALLSLLFFQKLEGQEEISIDGYSLQYLNILSNQALMLKDKGVEPNQIFMLLFSESINQSIISDSGSNYEDRVKSVLISIGINEKDIHKTHDKNDTSTEFDFFFKYNNKSFGIGAKRTLRERYKQFIKTDRMSNLDFMISITLGTDIRPNIANAIVNHDVILFVSDEIYDSKSYLQNNENIFPSREFNKTTFDKLCERLS